MFSRTLKRREHFSEHLNKYIRFPYIDDFWEEDYIDRLKGVYEKYELDFDTGKIPGMIETQISKGTGLQNYYEIISEQFDHAAEGEIRRATLYHSLNCFSVVFSQTILISTFLSVYMLDFCKFPCLFSKNISYRSFWALTLHYPPISNWWENL